MGEIPPISRKIPVKEYAQLMQRKQEERVTGLIQRDTVTLVRETAARIELARSDALVHGRVTLPGCTLRERLEDVETLNALALRGALDLTKISYHALGHLRRDYCLLKSGGALGRGCGPLIVARRKTTMERLRGKRGRRALEDEWQRSTHADAVEPAPQEIATRTRTER